MHDLNLPQSSTAAERGDPPIPNVFERLRPHASPNQDAVSSRTHLSWEWLAEEKPTLSCEDTIEAQEQAAKFVPGGVRQPGRRRRLGEFNRRLSAPKVG